MLDVIVRGGSLADGTGSPTLRLDVGIIGDRIAEVGRLDTEPASNVIDATNLTVAPGFIDTHSHSDVIMLAEPHCEAKIRQGVTTEIVGQDGLSFAPLSSEGIAFVRDYFGMVTGEPDIDWDWRTVGEYLDRVDRRVAVNVAYLVPHGALRFEAMGLDPREATPDELRTMRRASETALADGAVGLSTGLTYVPCCYSTTAELTALSVPFARAGRPYVVHGRRQGDTVIDPLRETVEVARQSGVAAHISHLKAPRRHGSGRAGEMLSFLESARHEGIDITYDSYPYALGASALHNLLPSDYARATRADLLDRLRSPSGRSRLRALLDEGWLYEWRHVIVSSVSPVHADWIGRSIAAIADEQDRDALDVACELLVAEDLAVGILIVDTTEPDMEQILAHPLQMVGSDGILAGPNPHPRAHGAFARILGHYVRERKHLRLEDAVRRMTSYPAQRFGLRDRGIVRPGMAADLVVFNAATVRDTATVENGRSFAEGVHTVLVNGTAVLRGGAMTGQLPGRALRN
jgi:N-acyl-D-amino-acid deacylase